MNKGFTLIEVLVSIAIFAILSASAYQLYSVIINSITYYRTQTAISSLADHYLEVARNLAYSKVGTLNGNPHGSLPDLPSALTVSYGGTNYQVYYVVNALHDPAETNIGVQDYKQIKLYIKNIATGKTNNFLTTVAPIALASMGTGGVLSIHVISKPPSSLDVPGAIINITNTSVSPSINLTRVADSTGRWTEIGLPADSHYHVVVTQNGYSTDQTYPASSYPGATNLDAAIIRGRVTETTFVIDKLSNLNFYALNQTCQPISSVGLNVQGAKLISAGIPKFSNSYTSNSSGLVHPTSTSSCSSTCGAASCCLEWDNYTPSVTGSTYMVYGSSPVQSVNLLPDSTQNFNLILGAKTDNSLLVVVKDVLGNPIEGATVDLKDSNNNHVTKITGGSVWTQSDWADGENYNVSQDEIPKALRLLKFNNQYASSGTLTSSTFDTGTSDTNYTTLNWQPNSQPQNTTLKVQLAANNDNATWNFLGPDGTSNTYYTVPGSTISSQLDGKRYVRYKAFLSTTNTAVTPTLSSISVNYVSGCPTPGQVIFPGLANATYSVTVSYADQNYTAQTFNPIVVSGYFILQVTLLQQ
jgi:prepilin-type N-terminal cleavage/methylation domain-containing protein